MIALSKVHKIELNQNLKTILKNPRNKDFLVHNIMTKRSPNGEPLITTELVIAGKVTRTQFPNAKKYPLHFVKRYGPTSFHSDPKIEYDNSCLVAEILKNPMPIGFNSNTFRNAYIPGIPYEKISPFGIEPIERNLDIAQNVPLATQIALWQLMEDGYKQIKKLHKNGYIHGDLEKHNLIVCKQPIGLFLIDFESVKCLDCCDNRELEIRKDLQVIFSEAIFIQSILGKQRSALGKASVKALDWLFEDPEPFKEILGKEDIPFG